MVGSRPQGPLGALCSCPHQSEEEVGPPCDPPPTPLCPRRWKDHNTVCAGVSSWSSG